VRTKTDESGYKLTFDYDVLDRLTKITFPDGTFDQVVYTRLDHTLILDRAGRQTTFEYNSIRQMTSALTYSIGRTCFSGANAELSKA
jgi:YD repeat-containing protein